MYIRYFARTNVVDWVSNKPIPRNSIITSHVHDRLVYDVKIIDTSLDALVAFSIPPRNEHVYAYWKDEGLEGAVMIPLNGIDYSSYYATKMVRKRRILTCDYAYKAVATAIDPRDFFREFGDIHKDMTEDQLKQAGIAYQKRF